ncbi:MAG: hypothetical protein ABW168_11045 [Sedimenticola sp.]
MDKKRKRAQQSARRRIKHLLLDSDIRKTDEVEISLLSTSDISSSDDEPSHIQVEVDAGCSRETSPVHLVQNEEFSDTASDGNNILTEENEHIWNTFDDAGVDIYPSSDDDESEEDQDTSFKKEIAEWAVNCNVPLTTLTKLLSILRHKNLDVPVEATTLLQTTKKIHVVNKSGGDYIYFGLESSIKRSLSTFSPENIDLIELSINIDGLPIYKSNNISVWPVQCTVANIKPKDPFVVALYSGKHKPQDCAFLEDFVAELKTIMETGIQFEGCSNPKSVCIRCFVCDAPAKAMVKATIQYNGRYGCDFCDVEGEFDGRMLFLYEGRPRTDHSFRQQSNPQHHKGKSVLLSLDIDMISQFPIDPMHCIDLGVTKRLLLLWKEGPIPYRLSASHLNLLSVYHKSLRQFLPKNFNRKPRGLDEVKLWKATEFRTFLMYTGPVVLKFVLPQKQYQHFLSFSVAISILYNAQLLQEHKKYAQDLLSFFVKKAQEIYSKRFVSYNVHCLQHMAEIAEKYKSLENCTAYTFENHMAKIKRCVRGPDSLLYKLPGD